MYFLQLFLQIQDPQRFLDSRAPIEKILGTHMRHLGRHRVSQTVLVAITAIFVIVAILVITILHGE